MRYRLRTLLILLAAGPPLVATAWWGWGEYEEVRERQKRVELLLKSNETSIPKWLQDELRER